MVLQTGDMALDTDHHLLYHGGREANPIKLTPMECRLLAILMESPDQVISHAQLMKKVWQTDYVGDTRTLHVHICWLRRKIEADPSRPCRIVTHRSLGYELKGAPSNLAKQPE
jgi:DNA-binding response OmpR family regulator